MYNRIIIVILLLVMVACGQADRVPPDVMSKEKMRDVLLDMNIADAFSYDLSPLSGAPMPDSIRQLKVKEFYRQVLDLHQVSVKEFMYSYKYYEGHPDRLKEVYSMMLATVAQKRNAIEGEERRQQYAEDPGKFFPHPKNTVLSKKQDTILPFLKRKQKQDTIPHLPVKKHKRDSILPLPKRKR